jgi:hypothetical protein
MKALTIAGLLLALTASRAPAAPYGDPEWPCSSRLVPQLSPSAVWSGPPIDKAGDWRKVKSVAELVEEIAPRKFDVAEGETAIDDFAKKLPKKDRSRLLTLAFAGLFEKIGAERSAIIERIKEFAKRQRNIGDQIAKVNADLDAIPADAKGADGDKRAELVQQKLYATKAFDNAERTVRYACEIPTDLEARLGAYARALQAKLPN